jgi:hypothetical protein
MYFTHIALGVPKSTNIKQLIREVSGFDSLFSSHVNHEEWYEKHEFSTGFVEDEDEPEDEGSGSSASHSGGGSDKDNTYRASGDEKPESSV